MWIALIAAITVLLVAVVWVAGLLLGASLSVLGAISAIIIVLGICIVLVRYAVGMSSARSFERNVVAQGAAQVARAKPDRRNEVMALQTQFQQAVSMLKRTKLGGGGVSALYTLPWFIIVGPPGAGKTTALRHSGLDFPLQQGNASAYKGFGGTRNCDWWFTNEAILLDTAGRYSVDTDDQEEWLAFLDLLRKNRALRPIDGVLMALSMQDLLTANEEQIDDIAKRLRMRGDEIAARLQMRVPIYIVFTKLDLLTGFVEMFGALRKSERGQVWGATFPLGMPDIAKGFDDHFNALIESLQSRLIRRFSEERQVEARRKMTRFVSELEALRPNMRRLLANLFTQNTFQESQIPRGFYFSSGTQEGRPSDRLVASMLAALNLPPPPEAATPRVDPKSYFLTDLFRRVVFADREIGDRTEAEKRRRIVIRLSSALAAVMFATTLLLPGMVACAKNRSLIVDASKSVTTLASTDWKQMGAALSILEPTRTQIVKLDEYEKNGAPIQLTWGMYAGDRVAPPLRRAYAKSLERTFVDATQQFLHDKVASVDTSALRSADDFSAQFDDLKLYLMLTDPSHVDPAWAAPRLVRAWASVPHTAIDNEEAVLLPHALLYLDLIKRGTVPPLPAEMTSVSRCRSTLSQIPQRERLYDSLVRDANSEVAPIRRESVFHGSVAPFVQSKHGVTVNGAYTRLGWQRVRALLGSEKEKLAAERWVLAEPVTQGHDEITELRQLYFEKYQAAWKAFLADLQVQDPGNAEVAIDELTALSEPEWPYLRLVKLLNENIALDMVETPTSQITAKAVASVESLLPLDAGLSKPREVSPVERAFKPIILFGLPPAGAKDDGSVPTGLAQYQQQLGKLGAVLTEIRDAGPSGDVASTAATAFQEAFRNVNNLLNQQDGFTRPLIAPLLLMPITYAWSNVVHDAGAATGAKWESQVWQRWHDGLSKHYPFDPAGNDAALNDFTDFFAPQSGALFSFYDESLKTMIDQNGSNFTPSRRFKVSLGFSPVLTEKCLKRGYEISQAFFPPKTEQPAVSFDVNLHSVNAAVSDVTLEVDGTVLTYRNEPQQWTTITWPGKTHGAKLKVKGAGGLSEEINRPGDFGLFHLLAAADLKGGGGSKTITATWQLKSTTTAAVVKIDVRPQRTENPFDPLFFRNYDCPRSMTGR